MPERSLAGGGPADSPEPLVYKAPAARSAGVVGVYLLLVAILLWVYLQGGSDFASRVVIPGLIVVVLVYLLRYASVRYRMDDTILVAWRLFGSRKVRLSEVRRIQRANLRSLGAVGFVGTWGWRGRVWSPVVGLFDTVHTVSEGLLVSGRGVPVFVSPSDPEAFMRELSRRVRSVNAGAEVELGEA